MKLPFSKNLGTVAVLMSIMAAGSISASAFQYANKDVLVGFRNGGAQDLVVNAGTISNFLSLTTGEKITINVDSGQLSGAFSDLNNLSLAVMSCVSSIGDTNYPLDTLWLSRPRADLNTQSDPWIRRSMSSQGLIVSRVNGIGNNAVTYSDQVGAGPNNTAAGIVEDSTSTYAYEKLIGAGGNFDNFQGNVEATTSATFDSDAQVVRLDFYLMRPDVSSLNSNPSVYLGYFEFNTNGVLTYTAGPSSTVMTAPTITSIVRDGATNIISFTTSASFHYDLSFTNSDGLLAPVSLWPVVGAPIPGTGSVESLTNVSTTPDLFYRIQVTP